ncbi:MAG TPA: dihydroneopterin aldolase [candidate division Zixibacteria bacterium]|nr:dihydroneopterin aldolase [candidate division Zixibacteria bacterium]
MGVIRIHNMSFFGYHGVSQAEKEIGKRYTVDIELAYDTRKASVSDDLRDTINYEDVYRAVGELVTRNTFHLTETLAERIAQAVFETFEPVGLRVKVRKNNPPFPGNLDYIEIETTRGEI